MNFLDMYIPSLWWGGWHMGMEDLYLDSCALVCMADNADVDAVK